MSRKIDVKIGSKEEKAWSDIALHAEQEIERGKRELVINEEILALAQRKVSEEKAKFI